MNVNFQATLPDPFKKLPALAERLGVKPSESKEASVVLCTADGRKYDLFDLINAVLDKIEAANQ